MKDDGKGNEILVPITKTGEIYRVPRTSWETKARTAFNGHFALHGMVWSRMIDTFGFEETKKIVWGLWGMLGEADAKKFAKERGITLGKGTPRDFFENGQQAIELMGLWANGLDLEVVESNNRITHNIMRRCPILEAWKAAGIPREKWPQLCHLAAAWDHYFARTLNPKMVVHGCDDRKYCRLPEGGDACEVIIELPPEAVVEVEKEALKYCHSCGYQLKRHYKFCPECGVSQT
jgi:hypothetical protein